MTRPEVFGGMAVCLGGGYTMRFAILAFLVVGCGGAVESLPSSAVETPDAGETCDPYTHRPAGPCRPHPVRCLLASGIEVEGCDGWWSTQAAVILAWDTGVCTIDSIRTVGTCTAGTVCRVMWRDYEVEAGVCQ